MEENINFDRLEEFQEFMKNSIGESDRGLTLIIAAYIEDCLRRIIESFLIDDKETRNLFEGPYAPFSSLSGKTKGAFVMGLITRNERDSIDAIRNVRNVFAHETSASFEHLKIEKICKKPIVNTGRMIMRDEFMHMALNAVLPLLYRDLKASSWRRLELTQDKLNN